MGTPLRILIIEDSPDDAELILRTLRRGGFDVTHRLVTRRGEMEAALAAQPWDLVLSDHAMPTFSAPGALRLLREGGHDIPVIIVTGISAEAVPAMLRQLGVRDCVLKSELEKLAPFIQCLLIEKEERRVWREESGEAEA